ncbi:MAG: hypothetical protein WCY88_14560 [Spongiibacteraceae bacterium]
MKNKLAAELRVREQHRREIEAQVEQFLKTGGSINRVPQYQQNAYMAKTWKPALAGSFENY